jgi:co-chaperonin GroES (HSP10)
MKHHPDDDTAQALVDRLLGYKHQDLEAGVNKVLVQTIASTTYKGPVVLPVDYGRADEHAIRGRVIRVGELRTDRGIILPSPIAVDDIVIFSNLKAGLEEVRLGGREIELRVLHHDRILAKETTDALTT